MIRLEKITVRELRKIISLSYENDLELFEKYHIVKGFENCVNSTMALIEEMILLKPLENYSVIYKGKKIGYVIKYEDVLYSYAINIRYRKKKILVSFWFEVCKLMNGIFRTFLYSNNIRAKNFLIRNGMNLVKEENNIITLIKI